MNSSMTDSLDSRILEAAAGYQYQTQIAGTGQLGPAAVYTAELGLDAYPPVS